MHAGVPTATSLVPRVTTKGASANGAGPNGSHPDGAPDVARDNGAIGMPTPIQMHQREMNVSEPEE